MNILGFIYLTFVNIKRDLRKSSINILFITICIFSLLIADNLTSTANRTIEDIALNNISNRQIDIHITQVRGEEALDFEEHLTSIKGIPNITDAYKSIHDISGLIDTQTAGKVSVYLKSGIEAHFPKVTKGRMFRLDESNVGIIPSEFSAFSIAEDKIVSGDDLIGEKITFYYSSERGEELEYSFEVIGTYHIDGFFYRGNNIYIPYDDLVDNLSLSYHQDRDSLFQLDDELMITAIVDRHENVTIVANELLKREGYAPSFGSDDRINSTSFSTIATFSNILFYMIIGAIFIIVTISLWNMVTDRMYDIALQKTMGYKNIHIALLLLLQMNILSILGYLGGIILSIPVLKLIIYPVMIDYFSNTFINISMVEGQINLKMPLLIIIVISIISCAGVMLRINKTSPRILMGDAQYE